MKAKEMFEELGYEDVAIHNNEIRYVKGAKQISFSKDVKNKGGFWIWRGKSYKKYKPNIKEMKAILQQSKELGW